MDQLVLFLIVFTAIAIFITLIEMWRSWTHKEPTRLQKDLRTLENQIGGLKKQGLTNELIVKKLAGAGWQEHVVEMVTHDVSRPNHKIEKIQAYADKQLAKGKEKEAIKETLLEAGWSEDIVDLVLKVE
ncbi:MAG: hypothetical protein NT001_04685 [Candidatus Woesearchaeota archaeon]|nr:hypothetical protein [Candidatus Woesearchaeota archaeon]